MSRSLIPMQNGSTVIRASLAAHEEWQFGVVLAHVKDNTLHPYVVWHVERHELNAEAWVALHGSLHKNIESAEAAFLAVTGRETT